MTVASRELVLVELRSVNRGLLFASPDLSDAASANVSISFSDLCVVARCCLIKACSPADPLLLPPVRFVSILR